MLGPIAACAFSCSMLPFIFLAPAQGAHYDSRRLANLADSSRLTASGAGRDGDGEAYLPADDRELSQLCHTVGFELACYRMRERLVNRSEPTSQPRSTGKNVLRKEIRATRREGRLTFRDHAHNGTAQSSDGCLPAGQLVFAHALRTGGLTVDSFLNCQCDSWGSCSVRHPDSDLFKVGSRLCEEATVCTMPRGVGRLEERCGPAFTIRQPRMFTVIRDPLERVWSFYHYMRHWYPPYAENSLPAIYQRFGADPNEGLAPTRTCARCAGELSNALTLRYFCRDEALCDSLSGVDMPQLPLMARALAQAKEVLASMDAVFMTEDLDSFDRMFNQDRRLYGPLADAAPKPSSCHVGKPASPWAMKAELKDPEAIRMISKYNRADIMLYKYAIALPNHWAKVPRVPGDGKRWQMEYMQTDGDRLLEAAAAEEAQGGTASRDVAANDTDASMENATADDIAGSTENQTANDTAGSMENEPASATATSMETETAAMGAATSPWFQEAEDLAAASMGDAAGSESGVVMHFSPGGAGDAAYKPLLMAAAPAEAQEGIVSWDMPANDTDASMENATANATAGSMENGTANATATSMENETAMGAATSPWIQEMEDLDAGMDEGGFENTVVINLPPGDAA